MDEKLWGVEVVEVAPGSPAERAGVQVGDFVLSAGGLEISDSSDLLRSRRQYHVGDEMPMTIWRDGECIEVVLVLDQEAAQAQP